jgi:hypothetical protein
MTSKTTNTTNSSNNKQSDHLKDLETTFGEERLEETSEMPSARIPSRIPQILLGLVVLAGIMFIGYLAMNPKIPKKINVTSGYQFSEFFSLENIKVYSNRIVLDIVPKANIPIERNTSFTASFFDADGNKLSEQAVPISGPKGERKNMTLPLDEGMREKVSQVKIWLTDQMQKSLREISGTTAQPR